MQPLYTMVLQLCGVCLLPSPCSLSGMLRWSQCAGLPVSRPFSSLSFNIFNSTLIRFLLNVFYLGLPEKSTVTLEYHINNDVLVYVCPKYFLGYNYTKFCICCLADNPIPWTSEISWTFHGFSFNVDHVLEETDILLAVKLLNNFRLEWGLIFRWHTPDQPYCLVKY